MHRRLFLCACLALAGCATVPPPRALTPAETALGELEPLYAATAGREAIVISVPSNGCTAKADFAFYVERKGQAVTVAFARRKLDACRSFATGRTELAFTWAELGLAPRSPIFLLNPLVAWTGPGV
ncbi:MAG: hypothetical protein JWP49_1214 [Phenylobacterium sp.]|nr:hypothetical protein [Phenylobacterium sp.]